ncbi:hypothetical protein PV10_03409 [Exophiala mesophila]|uniref:Uncharacterized protein n=1 Tax=Exophiala mesophila TaxID=212818 RepID=A0A0D1ZP94_EXOME|nr:uncharacterized protein PV10_03409 [Exophiala mesophila]KIV95799.1 hypothetical protein PV10_03409 [Exophiala mesophila]
MTSSLSSSTWRLLGLSVATSYIGLGSIGLLAPGFAAKGFGLYPDKAVSPAASQPTALNKAEDLHAHSVETAMSLLAVRDISIGVALFAFDYQRQPRAMATLIFSGVVLCVGDVAVIWKNRGTAWGTAFAFGAGLWMAIASGLWDQ